MTGSKPSHEIKEGSEPSEEDYKAEQQFLARNLDVKNGTEAVLTCITDFHNGFGNALNSSLQSPPGGKDKYEGEEQLHHIFHEVYRDAAEAINPMDFITDADIRSILYCCAGSCHALAEDFTGTAAFKLMTKTLIKKIEPPSTTCIALTNEELWRLAERLLQAPIYRKLPTLREAFREAFAGVCTEALDLTRRLVEDLVAMEAAYINIDDPDFADSLRAAGVLANDERWRAASATPTTEKKEESIRNMNRDVEVVKVLINGYFRIVQKILIEAVPKAIVLRFVTPVRDGVQGAMIECTYRSPRWKDFVEEAELAIRQYRDSRETVGCETDVAVEA